MKYIGHLYIKKIEISARRLFYIIGYGFTIDFKNFELSSIIKQIKNHQGQFIRVSFSVNCNPDFIFDNVSNILNPIVKESKKAALPLIDLQTEKFFEILKITYLFSSILIFVFIIKIINVYRNKYIKDNKKLL